MDGSSKTTAVSASTVRDAQLALWNGLKVGSSLILTWGVAVAVRFVLPRHLGPDGYGAYSFAEAMALTFFVFATLGVDTYVQKEIPLRPQSASEFFGVVALTRGVLSAILLLSLFLFLAATGRSADVQLAALAFGLGQLFFVQNTTFVSMLNARGSVDGMSIANVVTKVVWGVCILAAVHFHASLWVLAASFVFSEALRSVILFRLCRQHLSLKLTLRFDVLGPTLRRCAPFFVTALVITLNARVGTALMGYIANEREVGWFSAASMVSTLGLLLMPVFSATLLPLFTRARARSDDELRGMLQRVLPAVFLFALPASLALFVGAELWIHLVAGAEFAPAAGALRAIAPAFLLSYLAVLCASCLNLLGKAWVVTRISVVSLVVNALLLVILVPAGMERFGPGGAGIGAAAAGVLAELFACAFMLAALRGWVFSPSVVRTLGLLLLTTAAVIAVDFALKGLGNVRLVIDAIAFVAIALISRAVRPVELRTLVTQLRRSPAP